MKTTSCLHIFVVVATMAAIACSEPDETEEPKPRRSQASVKNVPPQNNLTPIPVSKFYTDVTTWTQTDSTNFIGLVSVLPYIPWSWTKLYGIHNDREILIDGQFDSKKVAAAQAMYGGYFWAKVQSNILIINYAGATPDSVPPFPLQIIIEY